MADESTYALSELSKKLLQIAKELEFEAAVLDEVDRSGSGRTIFDDRKASSEVMAISSAMEEAYRRLGRADRRLVRLLERFDPDQKTADLTAEWREKDVKLGIDPTEVKNIGF